MDNSPTKSRGCLGTVIGAVLGLGVGIYRGQTFVPTGPIYGDGMDRGFGLMGLALAGVVVGCVLGAIIGAFIKAD